MKRFEAPVFGSKTLEIRIEDGDVQLYGTADGLKRLAKLCGDLAERRGKDSTDHIHLEDYDLLTHRSQKATIAVFRST
ncbi:MAG: hypothetical protein HYX69_23120 [Planctomycetia bacterium]|nr:hypothetical protein [Planctomycetia bacterium]